MTTNLTDLEPSAQDPIPLAVLRELPLGSILILQDSGQVIIKVVGWCRFPDAHWRFSYRWITDDGAWSKSEMWVVPENVTVRYPKGWNQKRDDRDCGTDEEWAEKLQRVSLYSHEDGITELGLSYDDEARFSRWLERLANQRLALARSATFCACGHPERLHGNPELPLSGCREPTCYCHCFNPPGSA